MKSGKLLHFRAFGDPNIGEHAQARFGDLVDTHLEDVSSITFPSFKSSPPSARVGA
jgi:hypothetical protein